MITELTATVILVVGAPGEPEYEPVFAEWAERWEVGARLGGANVIRIAGREALQSALAEQAGADQARLWIVYLGHGTFDGTRAKLNLAGPDVAANELASWLDPITRPTAVAICASSSSPFLNALSREGRVVVTATKSGHQYSFSRFGDYLSRAIGNAAADLDKDQQVSMLEAFLHASAGVAEFYAADGRMPSEHALIDDNGDGLGTPASWYRGVRSTREPEDGRVADGTHAHRLHLVASARERSMPDELRRRRDELEQRVELLRARKETLAEDEYYRLLEELMLELARVYEKV